MNTGLYAIPEGQKIEFIPPQENIPPFGMNFRDWFEFKRKLEEKKSNVRKAISRIAKNGLNDAEGYTFTEASDVYEAVKDIMHDCKLGFTPELEREEVMNCRNGHQMTMVYMRITWTDLETGYFEYQSFAGSGQDDGDKGIFKGYTGAIKYALTSTFLIPTGNAAEPKKAQEKPPEEEEIKQPEAEIVQEDKKPTFASVQKVKTEEEPSLEDNGEGIATGQAEMIKARLESLASFTEGRNKKAAQTAALKSLTSKKELKQFGERIKGLDSIDKMISQLTRLEAEKAIVYMDEWVESKRLAKEKKEEKAMQQSVLREAANA
jgi:hypothetical protein